MISSMVYETLLSLHPTTLEYIPGSRHALADLAGQDDVTASGIDPNARFSDGTAGHRRRRRRDAGSFMMDKGLQDPPSAADVRQVRTASRRKQIHRQREEQGAQLAQLLLLLGVDADLSRRTC